MNYSSVAYCDTGPDPYRMSGIHMYDGIILYVTAAADTDALRLRTHNGVKPYAAFLFYMYVAQYYGIRRCKYIFCYFRGFHGIISFVVGGLLLLCNIMFCCLYSYIMPFHVRSVNWYFVSVCVHLMTGLLYAM